MRMMMMMSPMRKGPHKMVLMVISMETCKLSKKGSFSKTRMTWPTTKVRRTRERMQIRPLTLRMATRA